MLRIGIVGFGFMGRMHYANWSKCENAKVVAICDSDPDIIENSKKAGGNIEGADSAIDFDSLEVYSDFDKMLSDGVVDAISLTLPTFLHCSFTVKALEAGLHVLCEKPMALNVDECNKMAAAAVSSDKVLQIGHCIRFWPEYVKAKEIVDSGEYGKVIAATFSRLGSAPTWGADDWFASDDHSGGVAMDLHIHDSDYIQYLFGMPKSVQGFGSPASGKGLKCITTRFDYGDDKLVTAEGSWAMSPSFGFEMSFNIVMEKATIVYDCSREKAFRVCPGDGDEFTPEVATGDGYMREIEHFARLISGEKLPEVITLAQSTKSIELVKAEIKSIQTSQPVSL
ncbi:MAG: Gfo/Idh/MocA family oxidoreductase [Phycisphaerae bacterium]|nr:Gfo/Idh/MocA family oxidoreductase [Phycisphaerae bacterium]